MELVSDCKSRLEQTYKQLSTLQDYELNQSLMIDTLKTNLRLLEQRNQFLMMMDQAKDDKIDQEQKKGLLTTIGGSIIGALSGFAVGVLFIRN